MALPQKNWTTQMFRHRVLDEFCRRMAVDGRFPFEICTDPDMPPEDFFLKILLMDGDFFDKVRDQISYSEVLLFRKLAHQAGAKLREVQAGVGGENSADFKATSAVLKDVIAGYRALAPDKLGLRRQKAEKEEQKRQSNFIQRLKDGTGKGTFGGKRKLSARRGADVGG